MKPNLATDPQTPAARPTATPELAAAQYRELGLPLIHVGKVRELYHFSDDEILLIATDNISAFDYVLPSTIPDKGVVLTQLSRWWFNEIAFPNHLSPAQPPSSVETRAVVVKKLRMEPVEAVVRGYLTGSAWQEYQASQTAGGINLPSGLSHGDQLPAPIFTPAKKAEVGEHDENITFRQLASLVGQQSATELRDASLDIYRHAQQVADERGLLLVDTKFEFGRSADGTLVLADELLTPDSSRYWDKAGYEKGEFDSFDKQFVRNWLQNEAGWNKKPPAPKLPDPVVQATRKRYFEVFERLTGMALPASSVKVE